MFGSKPGEERAAGVMNQHVVSCLSAKLTKYWVLHTRGESSTSVLITALTKQAIRQKMDHDPERMAEWVAGLVRQVREAHVLTRREDYDRVKDTKVFTWGTTNEVTLESLVNTAKSSCVLAFEKVQQDGD